MYFTICIKGLQLEMVFPTIVRAKDIQGETTLFFSQSVKGDEGQKSFGLVVDEANKSEPRKIVNEGAIVLEA